MIYFIIGCSLTLNVILILFILIALRVKFIDCGNIFKFFKDDRVASNMITKTILEDDY